ncbi:conserved hypothetical protein [Leptospira interrogans serovar Manilae]|uniref:Uncharacterized protein n=1 Tax=Leptospira interrogans serovar Manilae TaxID=214675 RepID=A0AAQ1P1X5_LEPIR|nr:hypothetical protein [Leptospira interrogans]AKP25930.1 hypothetical protein LIMLP_08235 [Leptospira interrogans serovar Manilae]AKP29715.1 hypothetical protein LIMHP_08230 [Leptospira interrogans serovar Manilae]EYU62476.1 hypothetical protein CI00_20035 [Leptospira interrogans serovar Manilae]SOR63406.1 conserved hypothetical protein [Leptospira interrogans serovar Manilae]
MTDPKLKTEQISNSRIFDDSNMKLLRNTKIQTMGEGETSPIVPSRFAHALRQSVSETITPESLSRIVTGITIVLEQIQTVKLQLSEFAHVMRKTRDLGAEAGCHETGIAARLYTKRELKEIIQKLQELYRKY